MKNNIDNKRPRRRLRSLLILSVPCALIAVIGLVATARAARSMSPSSLGAYAIAQTSPPQAQVPWVTTRGEGTDHKRWHFSRCNTDGVEFRWRMTPDGWLDVVCREVVLEPPFDTHLILQRHPTVAELRIGGTAHPLNLQPNGTLALRVPLSLFLSGSIAVEMLAWETGADPTDDSQAFTRKAARINT